MNDHLGNHYKQNYVVEDLLRNLSYHPDGPCRNKIGITFNDHFSRIMDLKIGVFLGLQSCLIQKQWF